MQKRQFNNFKHNRGFTLIELLVVIALLGILAIALLATIDPLEQLKKGRDTATRNVLEEFNSAALRYYANKGGFPWTSNFSASALSLGATAYINSIIQQGELKSAFLNSKDLGKIYLSVDTSTSTFSVCYQPTSKAFRDNDFSKYNISGGTMPTTSCPAPTATNCYWCILN